MHVPLSGALTRARIVRCGLTAALALCASLAVAKPALASTHQYCLWDGSYASLSAGTLCFQSGTNYLIDNHAYLPYQPVNPTIFCGAHDSAGNQYAGYTAGNPSCDHAYSGSNLLKADQYVDVSATTHGDITW